MENYMQWLMVALLGIGFVLLAGCAGPSTEMGRAVFVVADAAANMGTVSRIQLTVDRVDAQSASGNWVAVSSTPRSYDLLQLHATGSQALLADVMLPNATYTQVRLSISNVLVTDANGTHQAKLPSGELRMVGQFTIHSSANSTDNNTATVRLDFEADRSLHMAGNGMYILAPVVHLQTREGVQVDERSDSDVRFSGGRTVSDVQISMGEDGEMGEGLRIGENANLTIDANGRIRGLGIVS